MSFKSILKNVLPYSVVRWYASRSAAGPDYLKYLEIGNSILHSSFSITVVNPEARKYVSIGNDSMLNCNILFESGAGKVAIGDRVYIGESTIICRSRIEFGSNIFVAWGVFFYDHDSHSLDFEKRQGDITQQLVDHRNGDVFIKNKDWGDVGTAPIKICDNSWIGFNTIILKGVTVGEGSIVGAGSVVTKDVPPWTVVGGNPARVLKQLSGPPTIQ